jgi:hypothetical protein
MRGKRSLYSAFRSTVIPRGLPRGALCAEHGAVLGGESPLHTVETGSVSLGKGVHREVESEGSR